MVGVDGLVRDAVRDDVAAICQFGEVHIRPHYTPLIGAQAADAQVRRWWNEVAIDAAVCAGLVVVAEDDGRLVGVGQRGRDGHDQVIYKLYVEPGLRGGGWGPRLVEALIRQMPSDADRVCVEHFAANVRAGAFYEREGFTVERVEPSASGDPALDVVWRARQLGTGRA